MLGRIYGLCAASFVLAVLLIHNVAPAGPVRPPAGDVRREAASERELRTERERLFSAVVESSNDAIITNVARRHHHRHGTGPPSACSASSIEAVGKHIDLIVPPDRRDEVATSSNRSAGAKGSKITRPCALHKDGRDRAMSR